MQDAFWERHVEQPER